MIATRPTILMTGAAGVLGCALTRALEAEQVVALAHRKKVPGAVLYGDITRAWLGLDPRDYRELAAKIDVVVHCAASVDFGASPRTLHKLNVAGVGHVLRFVADAHARLVHVSTAFVSRLTGTYTDTSQVMSAYARSKAAGETLVRESGLPAAIARVSTVIGDSADGHIARLQAFHYLLGASMRGLVPFLPSTPDARADLIPQDIAAEALAAMANTNIADGVYWITAGPAALPIPAIVEIAYDVAVEAMRRDPSARRIYAPAFKTRIVAPDTFNQLMAMVLVQSGHDTAPNGLGRLGALMASYNVADSFPTSLGRLPGGPPAPTEDAATRALTSMCRHLAALPKETWRMF